LRSSLRLFNRVGVAPVLASRIWNVKIDGDDHVVEIEQDDPMKGWPDAFHVDGQRCPIKLPFWLTARRFEFPFEIAHHPAMLIMSRRPRSETFWPRFKAAFLGRLRGGMGSAVQAANAVDPWSYEVLVDGKPAGPTIHTLADPKLQADVFDLLLMADGLAAGVEVVENDPCLHRRIHRMEVLEAPRFDGGGSWSGPWSERWTIDRCGELVPYVVDFTSDAGGGTNFGLRDPIDNPYQASG